MFKRTHTPKYVVVTTREELYSAIEQKEPRIEVRGKLAKKLCWLSKLSKTKRVALITGLTASAATVLTPMAPVTPAMLAIVPCVAGTNISAIILASGISLAAILAILKADIIEIGYNDSFIRLKMK